MRVRYEIRRHKGRRRQKDFATEESAKELQ